MAVSFIDGGNRGTLRKLPSCRKSLTNFNHIMLNRVHLAWAGFELTKLVVIGTDCIGSGKSNYHTITTTTDQSKKWRQIPVAPSPILSCHLSIRSFDKLQEVTTNTNNPNTILTRHAPLIKFRKWLQNVNDPNTILSHVYMLTVHCIYVCRPCVIICPHSQSLLYPFLS